MWCVAFACDMMCLYIEYSKGNVFPVGQVFFFIQKCRCLLAERQEKVTSRVAFALHTLHSCTPRPTSSPPANHALPAVRAPRAKVSATATEKGAARGGLSGEGLRCPPLVPDAPPPPGGPLLHAASPHAAEAMAAGCATRPSPLDAVAMPAGRQAGRPRARQPQRLLGVSTSTAATADATAAGAGRRRRHRRWRHRRRRPRRHRHRRCRPPPPLIPAGRGGGRSSR